jgi:hypothetical protein
MNQYEVNIFYKDDKSLKVLIKNEEIANFFDSLNTCQVYKHPDTGVGFWTNLQDIRYIMVNEKEEPSVKTVQTTDGKCNALPEGDENS